MSYMEQQMQQLMEASEHEYCGLMDMFNPPDNWNNPQWSKSGKVHDWRNYVDEGLRLTWNTFSGKHRIMLAANFQSIADREDWD